jgi:Methyltransferase domain
MSPCLFYPPHHCPTINSANNTKQEYTLQNTIKFISEKTVASIDFVLSWHSFDIHHSDCFFARKVNFYRDILPQKITDLVWGKTAGDTIELSSIMKDLVSSYSEDNEFPLEQRQFDRLYTAPVKIEPRFGRFYPKGLLKALPGIFRGNIEPFRCTGISNETITVDFNHPLAQKEGNLAVAIKDVRSSRGTLGGSCADWAETVTSGPGMQARCRGNPTDFFSDEPFTRANDDEDVIFYAEPRLVTHIDDVAASVIRDIYGKILQKGSKVLDLMSSWRSHVPHELGLDSLIGLGLNQEEMLQNPQLTDHVIHDLNSNPLLPFVGNEFDAVICTVSVEYLIHPFEVFREIARILKTDGYFIITFSNRWFPPKVIKIWTELHEFERIGLVLEYFSHAGLYKNLKTYSMRGLPRNEDDKYYPRMPDSDPIYAVWGQKG